MAFVEVNSSRFQAVEGPSVLTRRNFGLTRGKSLQEAAVILQNHGNELADEIQNDIEPIGKKRNSISFGQGGLGDKSSNVWEWPLGEASILNTETTFEVTVNFKPFKSKEVSATVMGTELVLQCKSDDKSRVGHREVVRNYQLPLNLDTQSVRFYVSQESSRLMITGDKVLPLKLAVAFFLPDDFEADENINANGRE